MRRRAQWQENHATCLAAYDAACRPAYPRNTLCSIPCSITYPAGRQRLLEEAVDEHISYYGISVIATYPLLQYPPGGHRLLEEAVDEHKLS